MSEYQDTFQFLLRHTAVLSEEQPDVALAYPLIDTGKFFRRMLQPPAGIGADLPDTSGLDASFRRFEFDRSALQKVSLNDDPKADPNPETNLVLFNVIVALEWTPDDVYLGMLEHAFKQVSDLLYAVTDSYMAIGQVVVGGRELMDCADIQIFASNRFYPRTAVNGLTVPEKYQPIRLGRGLWDKRNRHTNSWDEDNVELNKLGPRTIVHEWSHYALGLKDRYFRLDNEKFVVPAFSPVENTIMADVRDTEFSGCPPATQTREAASNENPKDRELSDWEMLSQHPAYSDLGISPCEHPKEREELLIPVPAFHVVGGAKDGRSPLRLRWKDVVAQYPLMNPAHCWVYVVKGSEIAEPTGLIAQGTIEEPTSSIAQGSVEGPADDFQLFGAEAGDFVVLIGNTGEGESFQPLVLYATIDQDGQPWAWREATPRRREGAAFPLVDVAVSDKQPLVSTGDTIRLPRYTIHLDGFDAQWSAVTFPLGLDRVEHQQTIDDLPVLEGHVMLVSKTEPRQITIASYSIGGSPGDSGFTGHPNPLPAGSAEGNAMLFFFDKDGKIYSAWLYPQDQVRAQHYEQFKIVTVMNPLNDAPPPGTWLPCSYAFSVTSNKSFKTLLAGETIDGSVSSTDLKPTLVLFYDDKTQDDSQGDLTIGRYSAESQTWDLISAPGTMHKPRTGFLIALALNEETAPGLFAEQPQAEHYRLFRKPAAASEVA